ncbi:hypothetical protein HanRHA438_Chr12g0548861 [Helianthus annuus]|nr:hypothetical protein HanRHA438_Chr12g0548861 [Helianthus annuus]
MFSQNLKITSTQFTHSRECCLPNHSHSPSNYTPPDNRSLQLHTTERTLIISVPAPVSQFLQEVSHLVRMMQVWKQFES